MKTLLLTFIFALTFSFVNAQCTEDASNFGNNNSIRRYNINGGVAVTLNTNNSFTLNFDENFSTAFGPDVRVYLINSENKTTNDLRDISRNGSGTLVFNDDSPVDNIQFGLIGFTGEQSFTADIPQGKNISDYDTVYFFCLQFNQFWDFGSFNSFNSSGCAVLSTESNLLNNVKIYPNPAQNEIQISNVNGVSSELRIFNILGKQVLFKSEIADKTIDISSLNPGVYMVRLIVDGKLKTQRLIIQ